MVTPVEIAGNGINNAMTVDGYPEGFRAVKRWRLAVRMWALTTLIMSTLIVIGAVVLIHLLWQHRPYSLWRLILTVSAIVGLCNVPMALGIVKSYPGRFRWR